MATRAGAYRAFRAAPSLIMSGRRALRAAGAHRQQGACAVQAKTKDLRSEGRGSYSFVAATSASARASARGLVSSLWGLGLRLTARGSTRLGR